MLFKKKMKTTVLTILDNIGTRIYWSSINKYWKPKNLKTASKLVYEMGPF